MIFSQMLLGLSDLALLLAVVGVYVFFAGLWLVYLWTERKSWGSPRQERRVQELRRNNLREIKGKQRQIQEAREESYAEAANDDALTATDDVESTSTAEIDQLRSELATVREVAMLTAAQVCDLEEEVKTLRDDAQQHIVTHHADTNETDTQVDASEPALPTLKLYTPEADQATSVDPELGLIYSDCPAEPDDLTRIWGVGKVNQQVLNENGVYTFSQIADWNEENIGKFNDILCFRGRIEREDWVGQASRLAETDQQRRAA